MESDVWIPFVEGDPGPPGHILVQDQEGRRGWLHPRNFRLGPIVSELTPEQIERIRGFKVVLAEHDPSTLERAIDNFSCDMHPEQEIRLWETMAKVYADELKDHPDAGPRERALIYRTIFSCPYSTRIEDVISYEPALKSFPRLAEVIRRFEAALQAPA